jgi:hypothetical protein
MPQNYAQDRLAVNPFFYPLENRRPRLRRVQPQDWRCRQPLGLEVHRLAGVIQEDSVFGPAPRFADHGPHTGMAVTGHISDL